MTIAAAGTGSLSTDDVAWRALPSGLWVARRDGRHLGTVQHGRRWLATDVDGEPIGTFRSFPEAQAAVALPQPRCAPAAPRSVAVPVLAVPVLAVAALGAAATVSAAGWAWVPFLL
jgi:hypothetical protein